ncbi:MAG: hypothetical protein ABSC05_36190 [Candidatus Solibacter sp.]|jgi:hypothetical protein
MKPVREASGKAGRKPAPIDLTELEKLCALQCTDEEIADWFGVSTRTIENRRKRPEFAQVMSRGRSRGRISVRRAQMKLLESGSGTMGVWLGKQFLGQRDVITNQHVGSGGGPIELAMKPDLSRFTDEELQQLRELALKALPHARD